MTSGNFWRFKVKKYYRLNNNITASEVRLIDSDAKQIGIVTLQEALKQSNAQNLDLVEIAPEAKPPVVKIIDFKKFKYLEAKKEKEAKKHAKQTELKEVRFSPFIGDHDFATAVEKIRKFISEGNLVKISIQFKGRQMAHQEFGPRLLAKILSSIEEIAQKDREERFEGRRFTTLVRPLKGASKKAQIQNNSNETQNQESSSKKI